ncbi:sulfatase family protein [Telluribacter sp.]|jgi:arylsulfatase A-like enzyme|uniref:sulfatase family protein n=1 Tax=Telluribacter sp. TaxID=1978767 RepID=UPI002E123103|nr:sulfatase-like hydrolase/transferase [Telluribacter sp.]
MKKTGLLSIMLCAGAALLYGFQTTSPTSAPQRPNVLIIMTDQQTNDCLSLMGNPNLKTPNMDALAKRGVYFTESYCSSPVCGPSRSSLITGRMPHETGVVWNNSAYISPSIPTIGTIFGKAGYNTAWTGKWHLPESYPAQSGKDSVNGFKVIPFQSLAKSWELGEDTDRPIADAAVKYLKNYKDSKPFMLAVSLHNPHDICHVPRQPANYAKASEIKASLPPLPPNFDPPMKEPQWLEEKRLMDHYGDELLRTQHYNEADWRAYLYHYYRFAEKVDGEIGKIMNALREQKLDNNTIIVFTSDHGDGSAAHKWAAKLSLYEEAVLVPFGISWKGHIPAGRIDRKQLVSNIDLAPTLCDYAGIPNPPAFTGTSLRKVLENPDATLREHVVVQLEDDKENQSRHARMIRDQRYKYNVYNQGTHNEQLFDLWNDPGETKNLAYETNYQPVKARLKKSLNQWMVKNQDSIPIP